MRFDQLKLTAFGHFTDFPLHFDPSKGFHLLYGPNEAGKSTTLRSISDFLYGFPQKTNDAFLHGNGSLRIEGQLHNSNGESLSYIRRKGRKNTVLDLNEKPLNEKMVEQFLQGLPESQFESMFALNHETLRQGGEALLQSGGSAGEGLFSAASGINVLRKIMDNLNKETGNLYKKSGSNPKLNKLLQQEKELNRKLSENQLKIKAWKELERQYQDGKREIEQLNNDLKTLRNKQRKLERIKQMLPKISKRQDLIQKIADLGTIPELPEDIKELRTSVEASLNAALREKEKLKKDIDGLQEQLGEISIPEKILEQASIIDDLYREVQGYQNNVNKIPELEGKRNQFKDQILTLMKELDGANADLKNVEQYRLSAEKKETIRELIKEKPLLDQNMANLEVESKKAERDLETKTEELANMPELPPNDELEAVIDKVKRADSIEEMIEKLSKACKQKELDLTNAIDMLLLWDGTYEEFVAFNVPILTETIKKFEKKQNDLLLSIQNVRDQMKQQQENMDHYEESIRQLDSRVEIPSEEKLLDVRTTRDVGWKIIRKKLQTGHWDENIEGYTNGDNIENVYGKQVQEADQIADTMRMAAEQVGEKNKLLSDIEKCKEKMADLEGKETILRNELRSWEQEWSGLWQETGITPLTPVEMKEWLDKYTAIKNMIKDYETNLDEWREHVSKKEQLKTELIQVLSTFGKASQVQSLNELLTIAEKQLKDIRERSVQHKSIESSILDLKQKIREYANLLKDQLELISGWKEKWNQSIQGTNISADTSTAVAEKVLQQYEKCAQDYDSLINVEQEQEAIREQIALFETKVQQLIQTIEITFEEQNPAFTVNKLNTTLQKAKADQVTRHNLNGQYEKQRIELKDAVDRFNEAQEILNGLFQKSNSKNLDELKEIEYKYMQKKDYLQGVQNIEEEMLSQGKLIEELIEEAAPYDADLLEGELETLDSELESLEGQRSDIEQAYGVVKKDYEEKVLGQSIASVQVEQEKSSIHAQIAELAEQYVQLKLASILLQKGIEEYRNQNQDPIITRAGVIFKQLTLESFIDLTVDYDEKDQPILMGVRNTGEKVALSGMSDGTTDQLYLALRIASIEEYMKDNEPVPFIVDDILVHFDDERSKETLKVLLELSKYTQIIFFTHHIRLVEIMKQITAEEEYQVIEINQKEPILNF